MMLGLVGDVEGNVAYYLSFENAKKIAAQMMMVEELTELDNMAKSALSELSNMLTANASINFAQNDLEVDISPPTTMFGEKFKCEMNSDKIIAIKMEIDGILLELNISLL
jgi:chemotaxis protein CheX